MLERAIALKSLQRAWEDVLANDREDGMLSPAISRFAEQAEDRLEELHDELAGGNYQPRDLTEVLMRDKDRVLHVPAVRDRIVERSILDVVGPVIDPHLGPAVYAYRPGLGVADAVQALVTLREEGLGWVLRTDIHECFPTIPVGHARRLMSALVNDDDLTALIDQLIGRATTRRGRGRGVVIGLPQGCALSPIMANLVLTALDDALLDAGFPVVRYADDLTVAASSPAEAWEAARIATGALEVLGMELGADKTEVMSFDEGFCFLGEDFGPRYPPLLSDDQVNVPNRRVLYTALQGGRVRVEAGRVIAETAEDQEVLDVPMEHVARVVCFGSVGLSDGVRAWAMSNDVDVAFVSRRGLYLGQLLSASSPTRVARVR